MATSAEPSAQQLATLIHLATLTHLEGQIRVAKTIPELQFLSVNETRRLVPYEQAYLLSGDVPGGGACQVVCASSVAVVERDAPMIHWLEQVARSLKQQPSSDAPMVVS